MPSSLQRELRTLVRRLVRSDSAVARASNAMLARGATPEETEAELARTLATCFRAAWAGERHMWRRWKAALAAIAGNRRLPVSGAGRALELEDGAMPQQAERAEQVLSPHRLRDERSASLSSPRIGADGGF